MEIVSPLLFGLFSCVLSLILLLSLSLRPGRQVAPYLRLKSPGVLRACPWVLLCVGVFALETVLTLFVAIPEDYRLWRCLSGLARALYRNVRTYERSCDDPTI